MKLIMLTAPNSNSGKTITTMILTRLLKEKGFDIRGFKCGPDFIDSKFLEIASKRPSSNLDLHLMGKEGLKKSLELNCGEFGILEGAMGYFDGIGTTMEGSAYDISRKLDINSILVYKPQGEMMSMIPKIKGMVDFSKGRIKGIIFSKTRKMLYEQYKNLVEKHLDIEVLGYVEDLKDFQIPNVELGLLEPTEVEEFSEKLTKAALNLEKTVDLEKILSLSKDIKLDLKNETLTPSLKIGIAKDEAFSFLYNENIKLIEKHFKIKYFSTLKDEEIPKVDMLYFPGGKIEKHLKNLSKNTSMINSIKEYFKLGGIIYGESGGLCYMAKSIKGLNMCGILKGDVEIKDKLQNFGYVNVILEKDCLLGKKNDKIPAHEFHYTTYKGEESPENFVEKASLTKNWKCGYILGNSYFSFQHVNFCGNEQVLENIVKIVKEQKCI